MYEKGHAEGYKNGLQDAKALLGQERSQAAAAADPRAAEPPSQSSEGSWAKELGQFAGMSESGLALAPPPNR
eukprot:1242250-Pyramimonas_sp.AAC.1